MDAFWALVVRRRRLILWLAVGVAVATWRFAPPLSYKQDVAAMFPEGDPRRVATEALRRVFGGEGMVLAVYQDPELLTPAGAERQRALAKRLLEIQGVESCFGLLTTSVGADVLAGSELGGKLKTIAGGFLLGHDEQTAALACLLDWDGLDLGGRRACIDALRSALEQETAGGVLAGEPVMLVDGYRLVEQDGRMLLFASTGVLAVSTLVMFPSLRYGLAPLAVVAWTWFVSRGAIAAVGMPLSMISSMVTAMTAILGVAATMHVLVRRQSLAEEIAPLEASARCTFRQLARPTLWAAATDAAAFMALWTIDVTPVQDYATMLVVASLTIPLAVFLLTPGCTFRPPPRRSSRGGPTRKLLAATLRQVHRRPRRIVAVMAAAGLFAAVGLPFAESDTNFVRNFRPGSRLVKAYTMVEENLGGAATWDVLVPTPLSIDQAWLADLRDVVAQLRNETQTPDSPLTGVLSLADAIDLLEASPAGWVARALPPEARIQALRLVSAELVDSMIAVDPQDGRRYTRVAMRGREDADDAAKRSARDRVQAIVQAKFPEAQIAGLHVLLAGLVENLVFGQPRSCLFAAGAVWLLLTVALRGPVRAAAALAPNLAPPAVLLAAMTLAGEPINMGVAMIAAVAVGISVDATLHYMCAYDDARRGGASHARALCRVHGDVGMALTLSTASLAAGFSALAVSSFLPTVYFGVLAALSMAGGLAGNLLWLPLILHWQNGRLARRTTDQPR